VHRGYQGSLPGRKSKLKFDSEANSYRWTSNNQNSNISCSICLELFDEEDLIISGLCSHAYHRECASMTWVEANNSCLMCRQPMFDEATYKAVEEQIIHLECQKVERKVFEEGHSLFAKEPRKPAGLSVSFDFSLQSNRNNNPFTHTSSKLDELWSPCSQTKSEIRNMRVH
jgi:hypothetical protein